MPPPAKRGRAIFVLISAGNHWHAAWSGWCSAPLNFTQEKKHNNVGEKNHEKIDSASENQTDIFDFGCLTCLMLKANAESVFCCCGNKPKPPNKQGCCKQVAATAQAEPSKAAAFAKAQLRLVFHTLPALKNEKQRSLTMSYGLKKTERGSLLIGTKLMLGFSGKERDAPSLW